MKTASQLLQRGRIGGCVLQVRVEQQDMRDGPRQDGREPGPDRGALSQVPRVPDHFRARGAHLDAKDSSTFTDAERLQSGYRYALALTHQPADAEDLVHEAWVNLYRRYGAVTSNALFFTAIRHSRRWLRALAAATWENEKE